VTDLQKFRMGLRVAINTLESAMSETDVDDMQARAIQAVNRILDSSPRIPAGTPVPYLLERVK
jgi:hypothetical protein